MALLLYNTCNLLLDLSAAGATIPLQGTLLEPAWSFDIAGRPGGLSGSECFDASNDHHVRMENNTRWVHWAAPEGVRPASGWPVFVMFEVQGWWPGPITSPQNPVSHGTPQTWSHTNATCGNGWSPHYHPPPPPPPPACAVLLQQHCGAAAASASASHNYTECERCASQVIKLARQQGLNCSIGRNPKNGRPLNWVGGFCWRHYERRKTWPITYGPFATPDDSIRFAFSSANGNLQFNQSVASSESSEADFPQAGLMWVQRVKQYLIANGIAILILNPFMADSWDWDTAQDWREGVDQPFLRDLFLAIGDGSFPAGGRFRPGSLFDASRVIVAGYSVGAQMASWMIQVTSSGQFPYLNVSGAVMLSGGSHLCYRNNPRWPAADGRGQPDPLHPALAQCSGCNASQLCGAQKIHNHPQPTPRCSNEYPDPKQPPCCQFCCPRGFTESWFHDDPSRYAIHPPTFLAQMTTGDKNADLCAAINYHETMLLHNASSTLSLVPTADERCYCIGTPALLKKLPDSTVAGVGGAADSWSVACGQIPPEPPNKQNYSDGLFKCMPHLMAHAAMVAPLARFVVEAVK